MRRLRLNPSFLRSPRTVSVACLSVVGALAGAQVPPPATFALDPERPRLVVLLHGVTPKPAEDRAAGIGTSVHSRYYWGPRFIQALTGYPDENPMKVIQPSAGGVLKIRSMSPTQWVETALPKALPGELAPIVLHNPLDSAAIENNSGEIGLQVRLLTKPSKNPPTHVMVAFRDGSTHLMTQTGATIDQVYDTYQAVYGKLPANAQPQIYFVGHSFGGVVARAIFANPSQGDLWGNTLTPTQRQRADFLRARTVFLFTLSSPHRGTHMGDSAGDVAAFMRRVGRWTIASLGGIDTLLAAEPLKRLDVETKFANVGRDALQTVLNNISGERDCLNDLLRTDEYNQGLLHPDTAVRPGGSKIPMYTAGGRSPGGLYFDRPRGTFVPNLRWLPNTFVNTFLSDRMGKQASQLYLIQSLLHREGYGYDGQRPWGTAKVPGSDIMASPFKGIGPAKARNLSDGIVIDVPLVAGILYDGLRGNPYTFAADGESDSDGFLAFDSAHGIGLPGTAWYRMYPAATYGDLLPWDIDNHGSLMFSVGNGLYLHNLLREAGPVPAGGRVSVWPMQKASPATPHTVSVQITEVSDPENNLDTLTQADFTVEVRIGYRMFRKNAPDDQKLVKNVGTFTRNDLLSTVIPISISVMERDTPDPDDYCTVSPNEGRDAVVVFFDTRTKTIWGDVNGPAGTEFTSQAPKAKDNNARIRFRITGS